jgi:hypothetical protein
VAPSVSVPPDVAPLVPDPLVPPVPASEGKLPSGVVEALRTRPEEWHAGNSIATLMALGPCTLTIILSFAGTRLAKVEQGEYGHSRRRSRTRTNMKSQDNPDHLMRVLLAMAV